MTRCGLVRYEWLDCLLKWLILGRRRLMNRGKRLGYAFLELCDSVIVVSSDLCHDGCARMAGHKYPNKRRNFGFEGGRWHGVFCSYWFFTPGSPPLRVCVSLSLSAPHPLPFPCASVRWAFATLDHDYHKSPRGNRDILSTLAIRIILKGTGFNLIRAG